MILNYPTLTLLRPKPDSRKGQTAKEAAVEKVETLLTFLKTNHRVKESDLILIIDSDDTVFQLPSDVLVDRYLKITSRKNKHLKGQYGKKFIVNPENNKERRKAQKYAQKVLFAARKDCSSNITDGAACASVPQSPLPPDIYGLKTDKRRDGTLTRPRWIESGAAMGQTSDLIPIYERVLEEMTKKPLRANEQLIFTNMFGAQEYSREIERRKSRSAFKDWMWNYMGILEATNVTKVRAHIQPGERHEFGMGLDYEGQLFLSTRKTLGDIEWLRYRDSRKVSSVQIQHGIPREVRLNLPLDVEQNPLNPFTKFKLTDSFFGKTANVTSLDVLPPSWNFTWNDLPLATYIQTGAVPALIHTNGESSVRQDFWANSWFHPWTRALLRNYMRSLPKIESVNQHLILGATDVLRYPDRKGGMWTDNDEWMSFEDLCGGLEGPIFEDDLGPWGAEKPKSLRAIYNLWGNLMAGKGPKHKKLGEMRSEAEDIERFILGIEEDGNDDEEEEAETE